MAKRLSVRQQCPRGGSLTVARSSSHNDHSWLQALCKATTALWLGKAAMRPSQPQGGLGAKRVGYILTASQTRSKVWDRWSFSKRKELGSKSGASAEVFGVN